ncbi:MAG: AAA family ATPase [Acidimicrobiaceae bacterium]|nr:AAA family ATPase [Acidimicrobiaceae bacterium]
MLLGPRRVGKSVEVKRTIENMITAGTDPRSIAHMSVDGFSSHDLVAFIRTAGRLMPQEGLRWWFIDEITSVSGGWPAQIKWLRDNDARFCRDTVVLTGSSSSNLRESTGELAGRRGPASDPDRLLLPIGFRTFLRLTHHDLKLEQLESSPRLSVTDLTPSRLSEAAYHLVPWLHILADAWEDYLRVGGFPQAIANHIRHQQPDDSLRIALKGVISGDAFQQSRLSELQTSEMLHRLARGLGSPYNVTHLAREIGVSPPTARRRIDDLRESFVAWPVYRERNLRPLLRAQEKIYFTDPVYTHLSDPASEPRIGPMDETALSEQQLAVALWRNIAWQHRGSHTRFDRVLYYRSDTGAEIDFVGPDLGTLAIESKYVDGRWRRNTGRTMAASRWWGIIATRTELNLDNLELSAIPASMLASLIDD